MARRTTPSGGSRYYSTYSQAGSIYAFNPQNQLKEILFQLLEKKHQVMMEERPFSLFVASALVHYYVKESGCFHPQNPYIITLDPVWAEVFGSCIFHVAELPEILKRLLLRVDGPYPPEDLTEWPLRVFGALDAPESEEVVRRIIGARPTWGLKPKFGHHFKSASDMQLLEEGALCFPTKAFCQVFGLQRQGYTLQQLQGALARVMATIPQDGRPPTTSQYVLLLPTAHPVSRLFGGTAFVSSHQVTALVSLNVVLPKRSARLTKEHPDQVQLFCIPSTKVNKIIDVLCRFCIRRTLKP